MDPITIAVTASLIAAAVGGSAETFLRRLFVRRESGRDRARDTEVLVERETMDLRQALETLESDIQVTPLPEVESERVSEDVRAMARILDARTAELREQLREQEKRSNEAAAKQERRSFWMDFVSNGFFFFLGLAVSAFSGLGGG